MKHMAKRILSLLLSLLLLCGLLAGCSTTAEPETTSPPPPTGRIKNIVLIIGDGMGPEHIKAAELATGEEMVFHDWQHTYSNTNSLNNLNNPDDVTDSAAAATAMATGQLTKNSRVAMDAKGKNELKTILDYASQNYGRVTGMVTSDVMSGATPAGFTGHAYNRTSTELILRSQVQSGVQLLCSASTEDTYELATGAGYTYCQDYSKIGETMSADKVYWQFDMAGANPATPLEQVTVDALNYLGQHESGFVLVIEQGYVDKYCHDTDLSGAIACVCSLNNTVKAVLDWIGDRNDTAIVITADHETGELKVSDQPEYSQSLTSGTGATLYYQFGSDQHTGTPVDLYVYGFRPDFSALSDNGDPALVKNTAVFRMMLELLQNPDHL